MSKVEKDISSEKFDTLKTSENLKPVSSEFIAQALGDLQKDVEGASMTEDGKKYQYERLSSLFEHITFDDSVQYAISIIEHTGTLSNSQFEQIRKSFMEDKAVLIEMFTIGTKLDPAQQQALWTKFYGGKLDAAILRKIDASVIEIAPGKKISGGILRRYIPGMAG